MSKYISPVQNFENEFSYHFTWSIFLKLKFSPPIKYRDCLFRLCPPCRYSARRQFWRSVKPGQSRLVEAFVRKLSEAADVEREQNEAEKKKQHGQARLIKKTILTLTLSGLQILNDTTRIIQNWLIFRLFGNISDYLNMQHVTCRRT